MKALRNMKRICLVSMFFLAIQGCAMNFWKLEGISDLDFSKVDAGSYDGHAEWGFLVKVALTVEADGARVTNIILTKHQNGLGKKAEVIIDYVVAKQSLEVDTISGATVSSLTILKAIKNALTN